MMVTDANWRNDEEWSRPDMGKVTIQFANQGNIVGLSSMDPPYMQMIMKPSSRRMRIL